MSVRWKLLLPIMFAGLLICVVANRMLLASASSEAEDTSRRGAATLTRYIAGLRRYYAGQVVADARKAGLAVGHSHRDDPGTIPLPATMVHELNESLDGDGVRSRLYSPYPFPWRVDTGGLRDDDDELEWRLLNERPDEPVVRRVEIEGEPYVRYAVADIMREQVCVDCHNTRADSPRVDWKIDDVRGVLAVTVPMREAIAAAESDAIRASIVIAMCTAALMTLIAWVARRSLFTPLQEMKVAAEQVALGDFNHEVRHRSRDEIGSLADSLRRSTAFLRRTSHAIQALGRGELERDVPPESDKDVLSHSINDASRELARRSLEITARNHDMRLVLDHVVQGFLTVDLDGRLGPQRAAVLDEWFAPPDSEAKLWDYLAPGDRQFTEWFAVSFAAVVEGTLPLELTLDQLPSTVVRDGRHFGLTYTPICKGEELRALLVVITDRSAEIEAERAEAEQWELVGVAQRIMADRAAFNEFIDEARTLVDRITTSSTDLARALHTLKGNAAIFQATSIATLAHTLESRLIERGRLDERDREELQSAWLGFLARIDPILGTPRDQIVLELDEYEAFAKDIAHGHSPARLLERVEGWQLERAQRRLAPLAEHARALAPRLGRDGVEVEIVGGTLRLPRLQLRPLWAALVHAVRNAMHHGIETPEERRAAGKPEAGHLELRVERTEDLLVVEIGDDGRGISLPDAIERARALGHAIPDDADLSTVLCAEGFSTAAGITDISGRGVGMGALRAVVLDLGGVLEIYSEPGSGTTLRIIVPTHPRLPTALAS